MKPGQVSKDEARTMRASVASRKLRYPGTSLTIDLEDAPEIEKALHQTILGWYPADMPSTRDDPRLSLVRKQNTGFMAQSVYLDETLHGLNVAAATCAVIADIAQDFLETHPGCLALHCGAFRYNNRLIAITGPSHAGKSTLTARLTVEPDMEVFCDDVLPLPEDGQAFALGIAPRLRLPLPTASSRTFQAHVATHLGPHDDRYGYVCAPTVAPHGTRAELSVVLILDRRTDGHAALHAVHEGEALRFLLSQNMTDLSNADRAFGKMSDLLAKVTCLRLAYADLEDAVSLLRTAFGADDAVSSATVIHPAIHKNQAETLPMARTDPDQRWMRSPDIVLQSKADTSFLWKTGTSLIWHMNAQAHAIWTMLEIPGSAIEIGNILADQFPDEGEEKIVGDVNALLQALAQAGMIEPVEDSNAWP